MLREYAGGFPDSFILHHGRSAAIAQDLGLDASSGSSGYPYARTHRLPGRRGLRCKFEWLFCFYDQP